ncbi:MAG: hypothetical protein FRX49_11317 [Trebouxia sp. A1-2]|nr:MAG: hypothetical protein FRX49_11317 [Trebouxia sp. A1-2]
MASPSESIARADTCSDEEPSSSRIALPSKASQYMIFLSVPAACIQPRVHLASVTPCIVMQMYSLTFDAETLAHHKLCMLMGTTKKYCKQGARRQTCSNKLALIRVVQRSLEEGVGKEAAAAMEGDYLHAGFHDLAVVVDGPHAHHALLTPTDDAGAVRGAADGSHSPLVRIVDGVQQLPTLRPKSTDLAITPTTDDALPILHSDGAYARHESPPARMLQTPRCTHVGMPHHGHCWAARPPPVCVVYHVLYSTTVMHVHQTGQDLGDMVMTTLHTGGEQQRKWSEYLKDISGGGTTVHVLVCCIYCKTGEAAPELAQLHITGDQLVGWRATDGIARLHIPQHLACRAYLFEMQCITTDHLV